LTIFTICNISTAQDNFTKAWEALNKNDRKEAERLLSKSTEADEFLSRIYLDYYNGKNDITDFRNEFYEKVENPYPYVYALWFNSAVLGGYGKKSAKHQLKMIDHIIDDEKAHGTLVAAAHYQKGMHLLFSNEFKSAAKEYDQIG